MELDAFWPNVGWANVKCGREFSDIVFKSPTSTKPHPATCFVSLTILSNLEATACSEGSRNFQKGGVLFYDGED